MAIQDAEGQTLLAGVPEDERLASSHMVGPDGDVISAGAAAVPTAAVLPGGALLARAGRRFPGVVESSYRWVAEHRTLLGKLVTEAAKRRADSVIASRS